MNTNNIIDLSQLQVQPNASAKSLVSLNENNEVILAENNSSTIDQEILDLQNYKLDKDEASTTYATIVNLNIESSRAQQAEKQNADAIVIIQNKQVEDGEELDKLGKEIGDNQKAITKIQNDLLTKVDKVPGKSLVEDTEIARLKTLTNYNDTAVKADISKLQSAVATNTTNIGLKLTKTEADTLYQPIGDYVTETQLNTKVDKVSGKSLVEDTEIAKLKTLTNYNDTAVKADIAQLKTDVSTNTTNIDLKLSKTEASSLYQPKGDYALKSQLDSKVDKVLGKSLIEDTEIARLKTLTNYDDTQVKADITQLQTDVEDNMHNISTNTTNIDLKLSKTEASTLYQPKGEYALKSDLNAKLDKSEASTTYATKAELQDAITGVSAKITEINSMI